jgi:hypothetical protein
MSSNSIGSDCKLMAVSVPMDEPLVWGRLAHELSEGEESMAHLIRRLIISGLCAEIERAVAVGNLQRTARLQSALKEITRIRRDYYGKKEDFGEVFARLEKDLRTSIGR